MKHVHLCRIKKTERENDYTPPVVEAANGGVVLADVSAFCESGEEDFPTFVFMQNTDCFTISTPIFEFAKLLTAYHDHISEK